MTSPAPETPDPTADATAAGLSVIAEATALQTDDPTAEIAARENLLDTIDELVDDPLTPRQEEVVEAIAVAGSTFTAGLSGALAAERHQPVNDVLTKAAATVLAARDAQVAHDAGEDDDTDTGDREGRGDTDGDDAADRGASDAD